ncbi:MAG: TlpA family protein disulfide reductase [Chloroflexota bacterium]|nr:TlpA family protein disulfide reductase [Chloroflexota bacterium]
MSAIDPTHASTTTPGRLPRVAAGLAIAVALAAVAWIVSERAGLGSIGQGGINQQLLPKVGDVAPDFKTADLFGNPVRLSQVRGQPVWLMFWGSWCPPCRVEFPEVQRAYERLEPDGPRLLGVSVRESPLDAASYAAQNGAAWLVLSDPTEADTDTAYPLYNVPTHLFIDADGIVRSVDVDSPRNLARSPSASRRKLKTFG